LELTTLLEVAWNNRIQNTDLDPGHPGHRGDSSSIPSFWLNPMSTTAGIEPPKSLDLEPYKDPITKVPNGLKWPDTILGKAITVDDNPTKRRTVLWDHLIYAYMIENTKIYEIFRRVLYELLYGEKLGVPLKEAQDWLRNTEELFYRDQPPFSITTVTSHIRSDMRASRRHAYQRMFGMDLNHGADDGKPYPFIRADAANNEFVSTFEEFLREVWIGIEHINNTSGANPKDDAKIADLVESLHDMLTSRRMNGNLSREEFVYVSMLSWFHLTVEFNSPIVVSLRAEASSPEQRLFKIAQRVGVPAHGLSKSYFDIADPISRVLILIETGAYSTPKAVPAFYSDGNLQAAMKTIIRHWSLITGREMKARKVVTT
jgi:hypothetical protein